MKDSELTISELNLKAETPRNRFNKEFERLQQPRNTQSYEVQSRNSSKRNSLKKKSRESSRDKSFFKKIEDKIESRFRQKMHEVSEKQKENQENLQSFRQSKQRMETDFQEKTHRTFDRFEEYLDSKLSNTLSPSKKRDLINTSNENLIEKQLLNDADKSEAEKLTSRHDLSDYRPTQRDTARNKVVSPHSDIKHTQRDTNREKNTLSPLVSQELSNSPLYSKQSNYVDKFLSNSNSNMNPSSNLRISNYNSYSNFRSEEIYAPNHGNSMNNNMSLDKLHYARDLETLINARKLKLEELDSEVKLQESKLQQNANASRMKYENLRMELVDEMETQKRKYRNEFEDMMHKLQEEDAKKRKELEREKHEFNMTKATIETELTQLRAELNKKKLEFEEKLNDTNEYYDSQVKQNASIEKDFNDLKIEKRKFELTRTEFNTMREQFDKDKIYFNTKMTQKEEELKLKEKAVRIQDVENEKTKDLLRSQQSKLKDKERELDDLIEDKEKKLIIQEKNLEIRMREEKDLSDKLRREKCDLENEMLNLKNLKEKDQILEDAKSKLNAEIDSFNERKKIFSLDKNNFKEEKEEYFAYKSKKEKDLKNLEDQNIDLKAKLNQKILEYEGYCKEYKERIDKVYKEEEHWRNKLDSLNELEDKNKRKESELMHIQQDLSETNKHEKSKIEELMSIIEMKSREIEEKEVFYKSAMSNLEAQTGNIKDKENYLATEKEKCMILQSKLKSIEKEMSEENHSFKMSYQRQKRENERITQLLEEKKQDLESQEKYIQKERELISREKESVELRLTEVERKSEYINKLNLDLDNNKKSLNLYYESKIQELEQKYNELKNEKHKVEIKLKEAQQLEDKKLELQARESQMDTKLNSMRDEFTKLNDLRTENMELKNEINSKINDYKIMLNTSVKCINCNQQQYVENLLHRNSIENYETDRKIENTADSLTKLDRQDLYIRDMQQFVHNSKINDNNMSNKANKGTNRLLSDRNNSSNNESSSKIYTPVQDVYGFEQFKPNYNNEIKQSIISPNSVQPETHRSMNSLENFPTTYFNQQLQEIESNMRLLNSEQYEKGSLKQHNDRDESYRTESDGVNRIEMIQDRIRKIEAEIQK